ncbi:MAG: hypothetical protein H0X68_01690 [Chloroflexi bacterium]|nr:hypothetical protein [Chloroflexota bacterium]
MKRISLVLVTLLALAVAACSSDQASPSPSEPAATVDPTPDPTPEPASQEPTDSTDTGGLPGNDAALLDLLPDEIGGQSRTDVDLAANPMVAAALEAQNMDASEVEYSVSTYGTGENVFGVTAMRIPDMGETQLEQFATLMTGMADGQGSVETETIGGKEVLVITAADVDQRAYMYFTQGAVFILGGGSDELAAELLSQLP